MIHNLNENWLFSGQLPDAEDASIACNLPVCAHSLLHRADLLDGLQLHDLGSEEKLQWVGDREWFFTRELAISAEQLCADALMIIFEGIDTYAEICLNGKVLGTAKNFHRTWEWDIKSYAHVGMNILSVRILPMRSVIHAQAAKMVEIDGVPVNTFVSERNWARQPACFHGWDWRPKHISAGLWKGVKLQEVRHARLKESLIEQTWDKNAVSLSIQQNFECFNIDGMTWTCRLNYQGETVASKSKALAATQSQIDLQIDEPRLWWPINLGEQPLYELDISLSDASGAVIDHARRTIGFRQFSLVRKPDQFGESFHFEFNGLPFFALGANLIPPTLLASEMTDRDFVLLAEKAATANMNCLRIWGGGVYPPDAFFEACNRLGICVWEDFMFGADIFPVFDEAFMANVKAEALEQIERLHSHPCVTVWCGNNEIEDNYLSDKWEYVEGRPWAKMAMSWTDYDKLFNELLVDCLKDFKVEANYVPSSPNNPWERSSRPSRDCGDVHYWVTWFDGVHPRDQQQESGAYRFVSEWGHQCLPDPQELAKLYPGWQVDADMDADPVLNHVERSQDGVRILREYALRYFGKAAQDFAQLVKQTQYLQGLTLKYAVASWRSRQPRCMGALYWQLNDCWQGATWATLDAQHRAKPGHHLFGRAAQPIAVFARYDRDTREASIWLVNDSGRTRTVTTQLDWVDLSGGKQSLTTHRSNTVAEHGKPILLEQRTLTEIEANHTLLQINAQTEGLAPYTDLEWFGEWGDITWPTPVFQLEVLESDQASLSVAISSDTPTACVWLEYGDGAWLDTDDACFPLIINQAKRVRIQLPEQVSATALISSLKISHMD
jgi:beta-mannosidase